MHRFPMLPRAGIALLALTLCAARPRPPRPAAAPGVPGESGYDLWLRYVPVEDAALLRSYRAALAEVVVEGGSPTLRAARAELRRGLSGLLAEEIPAADRPTRPGAVVVGTLRGSPVVAGLHLEAELAALGPEGYLIRSVRLPSGPATVVASQGEVGALYGVFALLRRVQTQRPVTGLSLSDRPRVALRLLDHWDDLDGGIERGYAGRSLWRWDELPGAVDPRIVDYARANASVGINGAVLNNVNADPRVLRADYLRKVAAIADALRPYGIRVWLSANFGAPLPPSATPDRPKHWGGVGALSTADPLDPAVRAWWRAKADEIYRLIPDFGGFLVKASSEGMPGPSDYGRSHVEGANMLAEALAPHGGIVMWRAFVYPEHADPDRAKRAYQEFEPLDGRFADNVLVQVKNGPLDFQPREPFSPLFGAMPRTRLALELQVTQEYLGQGTDLVYLAPMWKEVLESDTYAKGPGSTVARVVDGTLEGHRLTGMAGVANTGSERDWTGHPFAAANWYAFGRLAWDHELTSKAIADEWIRMTWGNDPAVVKPIEEIMLASREAAVDYMTPLGLAHIMATGHHYGPGPWAKTGRPDQTPSYFHRADTLGLGFDRTASGSDAVSQYFPPLRQRLASRDSVPEKYLLWFHHVGWNEKLRDGRTLWQSLVDHYQEGVDTVRWMHRTWDSLEGKVDEPRFEHVDSLLAVQEEVSRWWREAALQYFQTFSRQPFPPGTEPFAHPLEFYEKWRAPRVPEGF